MIAWLYMSWLTIDHPIFDIIFITTTTNHQPFPPPHHITHPAIKSNPRKPVVKVALQPPVSPSAPSSSSSYIPQSYEMLVWMNGQSPEVLEDTAAAGVEQLRSISLATRDPWAYTPKVAFVSLSWASWLLLYAPNTPLTPSIILLIHLVHTHDPWAYTPKVAFWPWYEFP